MSAWSELSGSCRLGSLVGAEKRHPPEKCEFCGARVPSAAEHQREWCAVLARYGLVYFIQAGVDGPIKIGFTQRPVDRRLMQIRPTAPHGLRLLLTVAGTRRTESSLHRAWRRWRLNGEWFEATSQLVQGIADLQRDPAVTKEKRRFRVDHLDRLRFAHIAIVKVNS